MTTQLRLTKTSLSIGLLAIASLMSQTAGAQSPSEKAPDRSFDDILVHQNGMTRVDNNLYMRTTATGRSYVAFGALGSQQLVERLEADKAAFATRSRRNTITGRLVNPLAIGLDKLIADIQASNPEAAPQTLMASLAKSIENVAGFFIADANAHPVPIDQVYGSCSGPALPPYTGAPFLAATNAADGGGAAHAEADKLLSTAPSATYYAYAGTIDPDGDVTSEQSQTMNNASASAATSYNGRLCEDIAQARITCAGNQTASISAVAWNEHNTCAEN
jgi:hypothetical protein